MQLKTVLLVTGCFGVSVSASAAAPELPLSVASGRWQTLDSRQDQGLQGLLDEQIRLNPRWSSLVADKKMAVGLVDLSNPELPRFASVNGDTTMYAASLPKIALLLAASESFEDGSLIETPEVVADLNDMIRVSSNQAATRMIDRLGYNKIQSVLRDPRYKLYDTEHGGGLWVGKRYAGAGPRVGDPLHNISHAASVSQVCRFYYLLAGGRLTSPQRSKQMLQALSNPGINHKFVRALSERVPGSSLFRKSGSWRQWHSDSTLVWGDANERFILVGLVEDSGGDQILTDLARQVDDLVRGLPPATESQPASPWVQ